MKVQNFCPHVGLWDTQNTSFKIIYWIPLINSHEWNVLQICENLHLSGKWMATFWVCAKSDHTLKPICEITSEGNYLMGSGISEQDLRSSSLMEKYITSFPSSHTWGRVGEHLPAVLFTCHLLQSLSSPLQEEIDCLTNCHSQHFCPTFKPSQFS